MLLFTCTVCGDASSIVTVYDFLEGSCRWTDAPPGVVGDTVNECTVKPFNMDCGSFLGTLSIVYAWEEGLSPFPQPNTQTYLNGVGLGSITSVGNLTVTRLAANWGGNTITLDFLTSLVQATGDVYIGILDTINDPPFPVTAFPGLANLRQVGRDISTLRTLATSPSWTGLQCVGGALGFFRDNRLTTLVGMDKLVQVNYVPTYTQGEDVITIDGEPLVSNKEVLAPLSRAAKCGGPPPSQSVAIFLPVCSNGIITWANLCDFISSGACPSDTCFDCVKGRISRARTRVQDRRALAGDGMHAGKGSGNAG
jgi:hypothetical protein